MAIERFEDIDGWQLARELTRMVYAATRNDGFAKDWGTTYRHESMERRTDEGGRPE